MKGYISIEIPTKLYIKAYLLAQLGEHSVMDVDHRFGNKLYDLLDHKTNEPKKLFAHTRYNCYMKMYVRYRTFKRRGANLI